MKRFALMSLILFATASLSAQFCSPTNIIAAAASAQGGGGTNWKTDVAIYNPNAAAATAYLYLVKAGVANPSPQEVRVPIGAHSTITLVDVVKEKFGFTGSGALAVLSMSLTDYITTGVEGPNFLVTSRTYNDQGAAGTYGQTINGTVFPNVYKASVTGIANNSRYRTNVGVVNLMGLYGFVTNTMVKAKVYNASGGLVHTLDFDMQPLSQLQQGLGATVDDGYVVFEAQGLYAEATMFVAYASRVDQLTGDAVYIPAAFNPGDYDDSGTEDNCDVICPTAAGRGWGR